MRASVPPLIKSRRGGMYARVHEKISPTHCQKHHSSVQWGDCLVDQTPRSGLSLMERPNAHCSSGMPSTLAIPA